MKSHEIVALEYGLTVFADLNNTDPFVIIWNTSLGLAKFEAVHLKGKFDKVLTIEATSSGLDEHSANTTPDANNLFSVIRTAMLKRFGTNFGPVYGYLNERPEILLTEVTRVIEKIDFSNVTLPNYNSLMNFETLDQTIKFDFINSDSIEIIGPATLVLRN